jgi:hypothetical protein
LPASVSTGPTQTAIGLLAKDETEAVIFWAGGVRRVALFPGLTWYVTPPGVLNAQVEPTVLVSITGRRALSLAQGPRAEALMRSPLGVTAPAVWLTRNGAAVDVSYVNFSADLVSTAARFKSADALWIAGQPASESLGLDPGVHEERVSLSRESRAALWLEFGAGTVSAPHAPPVGVAPGVFSLPLLGRPATVPRIENGSLVKGTSARIFAVENGALRWVPTLDVLQRRFPTLKLVTLGDADVWRLPVGLPLD